MPDASSIGARDAFRDLRIGIAFVLIPSSIHPPTHHGAVAACYAPDGSPAATHPAESSGSFQAGRLNRFCIFMARPMSPEILSFPLMKAIWPFSLPMIMST